MSRMPNMPMMPGVRHGNIPGVLKGYTAPGTKNTPANRPHEKKDKRDKRKAEKAARKKSRGR